MASPMSTMPLKTAGLLSALTKQTLLTTVLRHLLVTRTILNIRIDEEIENRNLILQAGAEKNNQQDAAILELDQRVDAISDASGTLLFKGRYVYALEKSEEACNEVYLACLIEAGGDPLLGWPM